MAHLDGTASGVSRRSFTETPDSVAGARGFVSEALTGLPVDLVDDVVIMISELATNAVVHARSAFEVQVARGDQLVRVEVRDRGPGLPTLRSAPLNAAHGRGLHLVEQLSDGWGSVTVDGGPDKLVWFLRRFGPAVPGEPEGSVGT